MSITVFGSAVRYVPPDIAALRFTVSRLADAPGDAFQQVKRAAADVRAFLDAAGVEDVVASRTTLREQMRFRDGLHERVGYTATRQFSAVLRPLSRLEEVLQGIVEAGAHTIDSVEFRTTRLLAERAHTRRSAVAAALDKARLYADAAGVALGPVERIEDVDPRSTEGNGEGHTTRTQPDGPTGAMDPGSILVTAAVRLQLGFQAGSQPPK